MKDEELRRRIVDVAKDRNVGLSEAKRIVERDMFRQRIIDAGSLMEIKQILLTMHPKL